APVRTGSGPSAARQSGRGRGFGIIFSIIPATRGWARRTRGSLPRRLAKGAGCAMALPKVVILGRPNVGKSSLLNWLAGRRIAIVDDVAGVTRDRVSTLVQVGDESEPRFFELIDTGGVGMVDRDDLTDHVERQIEAAIGEADLILFVVDIREELMPLDEEVAQRLRYVNTPVILVINKADSEAFDHPGGEF